MRETQQVTHPLDFCFRIQVASREMADVRRLPVPLWSVWVVLDRGPSRDRYSRESTSQ